MNSKIEKQLEEAKAHFYAWRMLDAYNILRRFFDRLPFQPDKKHGEYIGMFVRVLGELGRSAELKFYVATLERIYERQKNPTIGFTLAVVYLELSDRRPEAARRICEEVLSMPADPHLHIKVKMRLAHYYDAYKDDPASVRTIIYSIPEVEDRSLNRLVWIWKAKVARDEGRFDESEGILLQMALQAESDNDWYAAFCAENILALQYVQQKRIEDAGSLIAKMDAQFAGKSFKTVQRQIAYLQELLKKETQLGPLLFVPGEKQSTLVYSNQRLTLRNDTTSEKLLVMLLRKRLLEKETIVRNLYGRDYDSSTDDKIVYYHIHALRKRLKSIGVPAEAIVNEGDGYRWIPEVQTTGEEKWA